MADEKIHDPGSQVPAMRRLQETNGDAWEDWGGEDPKAARRRQVAWVRLLWLARRFLMRAVVAGMVAAVVLALLIPRRYEAVARLMPPDTQARSLPATFALAGGGGLGLEEVAGGILGTRNTSAIFIGVLGSNTVQDRLVEEFDLRRVYGVRRASDARETLARRTSISEERKSGIITIRVSDRSAQRAAALGAAYVRELDRLVVELSTSAAQRERVFLEERLAEAKQELDEAAREFSEFASESATLDITEQGKAMLQAASTLHAQLVVSETQLQSLLQAYTDNNVRVRAKRAEIAELRRQVQKLEGEEQSRAGGGAYPSLRELPMLGVTYADLYRRRKILETVYQALTQQYEMAKVQEVKEIPSVKVLDHPAIPEKSSFPPRLMIVFGGTILSFGFALTWVLGSAGWKQLEADDPGRQLGEEMLAALRRRGRSGGRSLAARFAWWRPKRLAAAGPGESNGREAEQEEEPSLTAPPQGAKDGDSEH